MECSSRKSLVQSLRHSNQGRFRRSNLNKQRVRLRHKLRPFNAEIKQAYKKTLTASGYQYMYLGDQLWGMTLAKAQAFCKKHGLKLVVAEKDNVMLMPSGTQGGPFDPKRMNLNIMGGKIVGVWPG